jgi:hypothetical protein
MSLPELNAEFAAIKDLPKKLILSRWLAFIISGNAENYYTLHEHQLYARIAVALGCPLDEASYISLPKQYVWRDIYNFFANDSRVDVEWVEREFLGWTLAAIRGEQNDQAKVAYFIDLPIKYTLALIVMSLFYAAQYNDNLDIGYLLYNDGIDFGNLNFK